MAIIIGTNGDDREPFELEGTALADEIFGLGSNDTLVGMTGDDMLQGGAGADKLFGSNGLDSASYRGSAEGVQIHLYNGYVGGGDAAGDELYSIEGVIGSAHRDALLGNDERNILRGEGGADFLLDYGGDDLLVGGGSDVRRGGAGADEMRGGDGTDFVDYSRSVQVRIDLAAGRGFGGEAEGDRLFNIEGVLGSELNDRISGNAGANQLAGNTGADTVSGGGGADRFFYLDDSDSDVAAADRILDFSRSQGDKLVVGTMDANAQIEGEQAFQFIGKNAFTGAGQLRWFQQNGDTVVEGNTSDAFAGAEFKIVLDPLLNLQASDFIFADIGFGPPGF